VDKIAKFRTPSLAWPVSGMIVNASLLGQDFVPLGRHTMTVVQAVTRKSQSNACKLAMIFPS
jgi:hypothetical protein